MKLAMTMFSILAASIVACSGSSTEFAMKEISYRGGLVQFEIPKDWIEATDTDGAGMFYANSPDAGTLRLSVITAESRTDLSPDEPLNMLKAFDSIDVKTLKPLANGNATASSVIRSSENGTPITVFFRYVTNFVPPKHSRVAIFSYTVSTPNEHSAKTISELDMIRNSAEKAKFPTDLGQLGT